jgi:DNA-binding protein H-NS
MTPLKDLIAQREALDLQIAETRHREMADAISRAQALVAEFGLSASDIFGGGRAAKAPKAPKAAKEPKLGGAKVAPKYRNPATGTTWTGRGKPPRWLDGKNRADFLIA